MLQRTLGAILAASLMAGAAAAQEPAPLAPVVSQAKAAMVPLRTTAAAIGASVLWDEANQSATVTHGNLEAVFALGAAEVSVNGQAVALAAPAELQDGRLHVPMQALHDLLGIQFQADGSVDAQGTTAVAFVKAFVAGQGDAFVAQFTPGLRAVMPAELLQTGAAAFAAYGGLKQVGVVGRTQTLVHDSVEMLASFDYVLVSAAVRFSPTGEIDDFSLMPFSGGAVPSPAPAYANPDSFTAQDLVLDAGGFPLSATLTLPNGEGPFPAMVLVHGSGPHDRDETMGGIKMFRDLAEGLASRGIAVLRFEKRSYVHPQKSTTDPAYGAYQESVADALAAVALLAKTDGIDPKQIFVAGHSQGGFLTPAILAKDTEGQIAGGIILAGPNQFAPALIRQFELLAKRGEMAPQQAAFMVSQLHMLIDPAFDPANPPEGWMLGAPTFWGDFKAPAAEPVKSHTAPLLILQGERDFQVDVQEFESWKIDLAERDNVAFKLYPKLNHFFGEGEGESSSYAEYMIPANVPLYVIEDIATWIGEQ